MRPRAPLGQISSNHPIHRAQVCNLCHCNFKAGVLCSCVNHELLSQAQKTKLTTNFKKDGLARVTLSESQSKSKEKGVEGMEIALMATQLAQQLSIPIDDIDSADSDNPQLCAEYVKDIYQYMRMLEVSFRTIHRC